MAAVSVCDTGLARSCPAMSGAEPWIGSKYACSSPMLPDGQRPMPPTVPPPRSLRMSPRKFSITSTSKCCGPATSACAAASA